LWTGTLRIPCCMLRMLTARPARPRRDADPLLRQRLTGAWLSLNISKATRMSKTAGRVCHADGLHVTACSQAAYILKLACLDHCYWSTFNMSQTHLTQALAHHQDTCLPWHQHLCVAIVACWDPLIRYGVHAREVTVAVQPACCVHLISEVAPAPLS
jgi:hypothetical protein